MIFEIAQKSLNNWATFVGTFIANNFQKSFNLLTLPMASECFNLPTII